MEQTGNDPHAIRLNGILVRVPSLLIVSVWWKSMNCRETERDREQMGLTLAGLAVLSELLTCGTLAVEAADGVTAQSFTPSIGLFTLVHIWQWENKHITFWTTDADRLQICNSLDNHFQMFTIWRHVNIFKQTSYETSPLYAGGC